MGFAAWAVGQTMLPVLDGSDGGREEVRHLRGDNDHAQRRGRDRGVRTCSGKQTRTIGGHSPGLLRCFRGVPPGF